MICCGWVASIFMRSDEGQSGLLLQGNRGWISKLQFFSVEGSILIGQSACFVANP